MSGSASAVEVTDARNNNAAENAIKRFAYYREGTAGCLTEAGLADYLVLLSLHQTCRYRG